MTAAAPSLPNSAASTCSPLGSMVMTASMPLAASAGERAGVAPACFIAATACALTSKTRSWKPPLMRLRAIGAPITPMPMKPIVFKNSLRGVQIRGPGLVNPARPPLKP